ncbi:helix-turn-helix transcriptional regulator [Solwaraspora sp. WMMD1047]|uniref:helix-turn-helix domain-containing protein n=1 Tax=Solwaraspora sp. WMMD1047 TaxID=3016102 RepID=UPI00241752B1|nr:helix-turn-helix transcriptional regulator [Solwaraspora sp. WMMD1047]MDG4828933.1 helix-turn-helix transcriptional regulator [Solwaraspora sp. WMMD1047]
MSTAYGPTVGRRKLRWAIRRAREAAGLTQEQVAQAMDWSLSKLIRIESGYVSISTNDVKALLSHYQVSDPGEVAELVQLARVSRQRTWWSQYRDSLPAAYYSYIGLEAEASALYFYQSVGMPGLLQTEAYAQSVVRTAFPDFDDEAEARASVELRMRRQREVFARADPPVIEVVLDEATLHRQTGGREVIREQLRHLVTLAEAGRTTIQVLPFTSTTYTPLGQFVIVRFAESGDSDVVYLESTGVEDVLDHPEAVTAHLRTFAALQQAALSPAESLARIASISAGLD